MIITPKVKLAMDMSISAHKKQKHGSVHYAVHTFEVMFILVEHGIFDEDSLCAAALHDCIEDTSVCFDVICRKFGEDIAGYVSELTDDPRLPREKQLHFQIKNMRYKSHVALGIKIADRIANLRRGPGQRMPRSTRLDHSAALSEMAKIRLKGLEISDDDPRHNLIKTIDSLIQTHYDAGAV